MSDYSGIMMENVWHELKAIREGQKAMAYVPRKLDVIDDRLRNVESDVKVMKAVLTEHSSELAELKQSVIQIQAIL